MGTRLGNFPYGFRDWIVACCVDGVCVCLDDGCKAENDAFNECKAGSANPHACLNEGKAVTSCAANVLAQVEAKCNDSFAALTKCLDANSLAYSECRPQVAAFEQCWQSPEFK